MSDSWLTASNKAGHFLAAEDFLIKDKAAEKQHHFSLLEYVHNVVW